MPCSISPEAKFYLMNDSLFEALQPTGLRLSRCMMLLENTALDCMLRRMIAVPPSSNCRGSRDVDLEIHISLPERLDPVARGHQQSLCGYPLSLPSVQSKPCLSCIQALVHAPTESTVWVTRLFLNPQTIICATPCPPNVLLPTNPCPLSPAMR